MWISLERALSHVEFDFSHHITSNSYNFVKKYITIKFFKELKVNFLTNQK